MAPIYADQPFPLIQTPSYAAKSAGKTTDMFDECASQMALVHNNVILGLNSIYLQAPHVKTEDQGTFCRYIMKWHQLLEVHHSGEEEDFFPTVETMAGETGIMEANVNQHHEFLDGLTELVTYVGGTLDGQEKYSGGRIVEMIDGFGKVLVKHLHDEIPTILGLRKYGLEKMGSLPAKFDEEGEKHMKTLGLTGMCLFFANYDLEFENGLWSSFPPAPGIIKFLCRQVVWRFTSDMWKFASCDRQGKLKPLYAVPESSDS